MWNWVKQGPFLWHSARFCQDAPLFQSHNIMVPSLELPITQVLLSCRLSSRLGIWSGPRKVHKHRPVLMSHTLAGQSAFLTQEAGSPVITFFKMSSNRCSRFLVNNTENVLPLSLLNTLYAVLNV
ncbi:hypothetical protein XELAEV_18024643mg [Xenopus laevis]|uniref:Uncharacterized protein n=1 Tax=Xenopus laevis TaxID=8355 RepID=A0A974CZA9_XENLA|nr:hypothetical protein XELAEV_18024643mg [Xenopus laevis]